MKKILVTIGKVLVFFMGWAIVAGLLPIPDSPNAAVWRFCAEAAPFLSIVGFTVALWLFEKRRVRLHIISSPLKNIAVGVGAGTIWIGSVAIVLIILGTMRITDCNQVQMLWLWILSVLLNAAMQELLVRGYMYQMLKAEYNVIVATAVTTALFTLLHGVSFQAGAVPVLNVVTMSLLMTIVLEYTQSLIAPILMHFIWNCIGSILLGGVVLASDYPHLFDAQFKGSVVLSGGSPKIEGSIVVLLVNTVLILAFGLLCRKRKHYA